MTAAKTPTKAAPTPTRPTRARAAKPADDQSWDAFWSEVQRKKLAERKKSATTVIRGVEVLVPADLPMRFDQDLAALGDSDDPDDVRHLVGELFGEGVLDAWVDAGMSEDEFKTALLWGVAVGRGRDMTFAQAYEAVLTEGKSLQAPPANRTARRASARSGGASKRISAASTRSPRKR